MNAIPGIKAIEPEGAFYVLADVKELMELKGIKTDRELTQLLLEKEQLVVNPGSAFGMPGYLRFSFATDLSTINKGLERLKQFATSKLQQRAVGGDPQLHT